jgi:hypothetical protein
MLCCCHGKRDSDEDEVQHHRSHQRERRNIPNDRQTVLFAEQ